MNKKMEGGEKEPKTIIAFRRGKESGTPWTRGYKLTIDPTTEKITAVEHISDWTESELQRDAVQIDNASYSEEDPDNYGNQDLPAPKPGDPAPEGWREWRAARDHDLERTAG